MKQEVLKKHIGAIQINGRLTLLQRKVFNVLLLHAYPHLPEKDEFTISTGELARLAGFDSHNTAKLKSSFRALARTTVEWNILDGEVDEQWTTSALLADATIMRNKGLCAYSYSNRLKEKLYHPEIYAQINLKIQRQFKSAHALVLYENCARFRNVKTTGWISLDDWRKLFGIKDGQYGEFKAFSRRVVKTAVNEVNAHSDLLVTPEYRKEQGRVVAIKFLIKSNRLGLTSNDGAVAPGLLDQLISAGVTKKQAELIIDTYLPAHIEQGLAYMRKMITSGSVIRAPGAYLKKAISHNYGATHNNSRDDVSNASFKPVSSTRQEHVNTIGVLETLHSAQCLALINDKLSALNQDAQNSLESKFKSTLDSVTRELFKKRGWSSPMLFSKVIEFWAQEQGVLFPSLDDIAREQDIEMPILQ